MQTVSSDMGEIRSFGAAQQEQAITLVPFDWYGKLFHIQLPLPSMSILDMGASADKSGAEAVVAFMHFLEDLIPEDEWPRFKQVTRAKRVDENGLLDLVRWSMESATGFPTEQRSDSSGIASSDTTTSPDAASPPVLVSQL